MIKRAVPDSAITCWRQTCDEAPINVEAFRFRGATGVEEAHLTARPVLAGSTAEQLDWLARGVRSLGFDDESAVWRRFFCGDLERDVQTLHASSSFNRSAGGTACAVSWVEQPPADPARVALWAYHVRDPGGELDKQIEGETMTLRRGALRHCWTPRITDENGDGVFEQTRDVFERYEETLGRRGLALAENTMRAWLFLRDIDADYADMARARRELFAERGLTPSTHYIASTGIGGLSAIPTARLTMDAYAIGGVRAEQVSYIKALSHLSPTDAYGVTFERATAVSYRDRKHIFISGTASIDQRGELLHEGDLHRQLDRTLDNIAALLAEAGAGREHMSVLIAYVRNSEDGPAVRRRIRERYADTPVVVVTASVCRPQWLVEIEGQAIVPGFHPDLPSF